MLNHFFYLQTQKKDKNDKIPVYIDLSFDGQRIRKAVKKIKIKSADWNPSKQRVRKPSRNGEYNNYEEYNEILEDLTEAVHRINKVSLKFNITLSKQYVLEKLENPRSIELEERSFFKVFDEYLETSRSTKAEWTIKGHRTAQRFLENFEKKTKYKITFENIDLSFFETLRKYAYQEKGIANNYFARIIAALKAFMTWSFDKGYHINLEYKKFKAPEIEKEVIYLTVDELMKFYKHDFKSRKLEHVRDTYCFGCFTGLRFSDIRSLNMSHIRDGYIVKSIQKTGEVNNRIPLNKYALEILKKYEGSIHEPLPIISVQKFNKYLKDCAEEADINSPTAVVRQSGGKRIETVVPKHQLITSHTARKTFVTNSLILGMKEMVVRNITGHKKEENFRRYVKIAEEFKKSEMDNTWDKI
ncbi:site-specific integrase [Reichenbachiella ulvae]|uniref:Site-specific integrase n=1 Tax=Reichenbachiella ulvae TaxID=2980104 RepID=A0ABT3D082_9BACT|nr:site-specific integrase [Reichenbachiella ulvae]MCV9389164.1 site-specific integrase [Reichenbachiella ulvae]